MAGAGSTAFMFTKKGLVAIDKANADEDTLIEIALDLGTDDPAMDSDPVEITCDPSILEPLKSALAAKKVPTVSAEITMVPSSTVKVMGSDAKNVLGLMEALEEHEDIQAVHANFDIPDEEMAKLAEE